MTEKERAQLYRDVFNNVSGRKLLGDMLVRNYICNQITGGSEWERGICEGRRRLAMEMAGYIGALPGTFPEDIATGFAQWEPMNA